MHLAAELAGFFAAHAIWNVSDGGPLIPMLAYRAADGGRQLERLALDNLESAVAQGKSRLTANPMDADDAALLYDGRITLGAEKQDAIIIEIRTYFSPDSEAIIAIPYTPKELGRFLVHKPKLLVWSNCDDFETNAVLQSFFEGVDSHEKGAKVWSDCLDESK